MAEKFYTVASLGTSILQNKCLLGIFNGTGSGQVIRIYRVILLNNQTSAVTGTTALFTIAKFSTGSGGIPLNPVKHDSQNVNLPSQIITSTNMTYTTSEILRRFPWSNDEPVAATAATMDEIQLIPTWNMPVAYDWSLYNTTMQPFVLRTGEGLGIINNTATNVGVIDCFIEFSIDVT